MASAIRSLQVTRRLLHTRDPERLPVVGKHRLVVSLSLGFPTDRISTPVCQSSTFSISCSVISLLGIFQCVCIANNRLAAQSEPHANSNIRSQNRRHGHPTLGISAAQRWKSPG